MSTKPEFANSEEYWKFYKGKYPHHTTRPIGEPRPEVWREVVNPPDAYIVCPFDKQAHWGFTSAAELDRFNHTFPDPRK